MACACHRERLGLVLIVLDLYGSVCACLRFDMHCGKFKEHKFKEQTRSCD